MKRFRNILLVAESDVQGDRALRHAVHLTKSNDAKLCVISVAPPLPWEARRLAHRFMSEEELRHQLEQERRDQLTLLSEAIWAEGIAAKTRLRVGTPFVEIIREVLRQKHDLVIKAPTASEASERTALGSLDMHLVRKCPCPVWIIKPGNRRRFARVLAAVNPDPRDEDRNLVNTLVMGLATSLARAEQSELYVVNAWSVLGEAVLRALRKRLSEADVKEAIRDIGDARAEMLQALRTRYDLHGAGKHVEVLKGHPENAVPALVARKGVDLLVMGSMEHASQSGVLIGNTAENILRKVQCSLLTVKPPGFDTPVKLDASDGCGQ